MYDLKPEERARQWIDMKLQEAGWNVVNRNEFAPNMTAVAIREVLMKGGLRADYILLIDGKAAAVLEAKREEISLNNPHLTAQAERYTQKVLPWYPAIELPLPIIYISNGKNIAVKDCRVANSIFKQIDKFPRPWDLARALELDEFAGLPYLKNDGLRNCQYEALSNLEQSFREGKRRALISLATGAGKTFTACMLAYRMLAFTPMKRVLFLVDRTNLGKAALTALQSFSLTENGEQMSKIFGIEQLTSKPIGSRTSIVVSTIQRLYSQLIGSTDNYSEEEEDSCFGRTEGVQIELPQNLNLPPDYFDLIIIDECHRSIYSDWKQVLMYFNKARMVGLTATPIPESLAFFDNNCVVNYTYDQSVLDNVNVPYRIYRIKTEITEEGGDIHTGDRLVSTSNKDGTRKEQTAIKDRKFVKQQLNREIVVRDQIRKVLQEYKDIVYTRLFTDRDPDYAYIPKTLIFAVNEHHAKLIVDVAKEVFEQSDFPAFAQTITYSAPDSNKLIREVNTDPNFRIAVTVTLVATGTDVKSLEVLLFLSDVKSLTLYTQMKGRGCRTISPEQLRAVTPNATSKELFYLIDAVGVSESEKHVSSLSTDVKGPGNPSLEDLFERMSLGYLPDDYFNLLASKLSVIGRKATPEDLLELSKVSPETPNEWAERIMTVLDAGNLPPFVDASRDNKERKGVIAKLLNNVPARNKMVEIARGYIKEIVGVADSITYSGFSREAAESSTKAFDAYVKTHRDEIEALRCIYNQETGKLTRTVMDQLSKNLSVNLPEFSVRKLWSEFAMLYNNVTPLSSEDELAITHLIQLVRYSYGLIDNLAPLTGMAAQRFPLWFHQAQRGISEEHKELFRTVASYIAMNGSCSLQELFEFDADITAKVVRACSTPESANDHLYTLSEFILKAA